MWASSASSVNVPSGPRNATLSLPFAKPLHSSWSSLRSYPLGYQTTPAGSPGRGCADEGGLTVGAARGPRRTARRIGRGSAA